MLVYARVLADSQSAADPALLQLHLAQRKAPAAEVAVSVPVQDGGMAAHTFPESEGHLDRA